MSRFFAILLIVGAAIVSFGLYQLSYEVKRLEEELAELNRAVIQDRESVLVLNAEWSFLTRPAALQDKAARNLELRPVSPKQVLSLADVPTKQERLKLDTPATAPALVKTKPAAPSPAMAALPAASQARLAAPGTGGAQ
jgi:hypothetical protein